MFELFIARRYLRAKRKQVVISVITVISVIGVAAGVMALVIALAINSGLRRHTQARSVGRHAPTSLILEKDPSEGIGDWEALTPKLSKLPHVSSAAPALYEPGYLSGPVNSDGRRRQGHPSLGPASSFPTLCGI